MTQVVHLHVGGRGGRIGASGGSLCVGVVILAGNILGFVEGRDLIVEALLLYVGWKSFEEHPFGRFIREIRTTYLREKIVEFAEVGFEVLVILPKS